MLLERIGEVEGRISRVVNHAECGSAEQTQAVYASMGRENGELMSKIQEEQWDIEDVEEEIERIRLEKRNSECTD